MMNKEKEPSFFIVGAAKSGTSSLAKMLSQHPDIFISGIKEPCFYIEDVGIQSIDEYIGLFKSAKSNQICGEASTGYLFDPKVPEKIFKDYKNAKIIILLRNPSEMALSYWRYMTVVGNETLSYQDAISEKTRRYRKTEQFKKQCINWWASYLYIERAMYYDQVKRYFETFPPENILVFLFDDFKNNSQKVCRDIFHLLNVRDDFTPKPVHSNKGGEIRSKFIKKYIYQREYPILRKIISPNHREFIRFKVRDLNRKKTSTTNREKDPCIPDLKALFIQDIKLLETLIQRNLSCWR